MSGFENGKAEVGLSPNVAAGLAMRADRNGGGWTWGSDGNGIYVEPANLGDAAPRVIAEEAPRPEYASPLLAQRLGGSGIAGYAQAA